MNCQPHPTATRWSPLFITAALSVLATFWAPRIQAATINLTDPPRASSCDPMQIQILQRAGGSVFHKIIDLRLKAQEQARDLGTENAQQAHQLEQASRVLGRALNNLLDALTLSCERSAPHAELLIDLDAANALSLKVYPGFWTLLQHIPQPFASASLSDTESFLVASFVHEIVRTAGARQLDDEHIAPTLGADSPWPFQSKTYLEWASSGLTLPSIGPSPNKHPILLALSAAYRRGHELEDDIRVWLANHPHAEDNRHMQQARRKVQCALEHLPFIKFRIFQTEKTIQHRDGSESLIRAETRFCKSRPGGERFADCVDLQSNETQLATDEIALYSSFEGKPVAEKAAILFHESLHKCGVDHYEDHRVEEASPPWVESYETWLLRGFCHPEDRSCAAIRF